VNWLLLKGSLLYCLIKTGLGQRKGVMTRAKVFLPLAWKTFSQFPAGESNHTCNFLQELEKTLDKIT